MDNNKEKKKLNLSGAFAIALALLILVVFVPLNMIFSYSDKVFDMTPNGKYSLDEKTDRTLFLKKQSPITMSLFTKTTLLKPKSKIRLNP